MKTMSGWKTWASVVIIGLAAALEALGGEYAEYSKVLLMVGGAFGLVGVGHKLEKGKEQK